MIANICENRKMDAIEEIALIVVPAPERSGERGRVARLLAQRRKQFANRLRTEIASSAAGQAPDPLLVTLAGLHRQRLETEMISRLLVAYGREFVRPRPYRLVDLADAAAMSISGIRTAYGDEEIERVAEVLGRRPAPGRSAEESQ
jgi:hypothetical protein